MFDRLSQDTSVAQEQKIARMRAKHAELRERLLNPNVRICGRDTEALAAQIAEKQERVARERRDDQDYASFVSQVNDHLREQDVRSLEEKRLEDAQLRSYWRQQSESKNAAPGDDSGPEVSYGTSSAQVFEGEDRDRDDRIKQQRAELSNWCKHSMLEKDQRQREARNVEMDYAAHIIQVKDICDRVEEDLILSKKAENEAYKTDNRILAEAKARRDAEQKLSERDYIARRIIPDETFESMKRRDAYRGMTKQELQNIRNEQLRQVQEKQAARNEARHADEMYAASQENTLNHAEYAYEVELNREREAKREVFDDNQRLVALLKSERERKIKEDKAKPDIGDDFFAQFGTSHR